MSECERGSSRSRQASLGGGAFLCGDVIDDFITNFAAPLALTVELPRVFLVTAPPPALNCPPLPPPSPSPVNSHSPYLFHAPLPSAFFLPFPLDFSMFFGCISEQISADFGADPGWIRVVIWVDSGALNAGCRGARNGVACVSSVQGRFER